MTVGRDKVCGEFGPNLKYPSKEQNADSCKYPSIGFVSLASDKELTNVVHFCDVTLTAHAFFMCLQMCAS